jgi:hypothetical protein
MPFGAIEEREKSAVADDLLLQSDPKFSTVSTFNGMVPTPAAESSVCRPVGSGEPE